MTLTVPFARHRGRRITRRAAAGFLTVAVLLGTTACGGSDSATGPANNNPVGVYALRQVDGKALPVEVARNRRYYPDTDDWVESSVRITGGEVTLSDDGSFHLAIDYVLRLNDFELRNSNEEDGTYEITGNKISFDGSIDDTLRNGDLTLQLTRFGNEKPNKYIFRFTP